MTYLSISLKSVLLATLGASAIALSGCNKPAETTATDANEPAATSVSDTIRIATESSYKPFSYTDASGKLIGYEIDLTNALCEQMKAKCEIISQDWDGLIPGLNAKKFDAIIAGMSITPERQQVVDFTDPYFHSGIILIAKKGENLTIDTLKGVSVGTQRSTVSSQYLQDNHPEADIKLYDTQESANLDLTSGRVKAILADKVIGLDWLKTPAGADYEVKGQEISSDNGDAMGIAFRKGDPLVAKFNSALAELKANGKYDEITDSYFGTSTTLAAHAMATHVTEPDQGKDVDSVVVVEGNDAKVDDQQLINAEENTEEQPEVMD